MAVSSWVFENFILANEPFAKFLQIFETCVSVNESLYRKSVSSLKFAESFKVNFFYSMC